MAICYIPWQPLAVVVLIERDGKVLAISRRDAPEDLGLPGGKLEPGEMPEEALRREVLEEVGLEISEPELCFVARDVESAQVWCYVARYRGEPKAMEAGFVVEWVERERLLEESCTFREYNRQLFEALDGNKE